MIVRTTVIAAMAAGTIASGSAYGADGTVKLQLANAYPSAMSLVGPAAANVAKNIEDLSGGTVEIEVFAPGALLPPGEYFDSIASGALDAAFIDTLPWTGKDIAFALYTNVPFGPGAPEYLAWMRQGGGQELMQELFAQFNIVAMPCGLLSPEGGGWYRNPIETVADLDGLKYRIGGLGGNVMQKLGVATQQIAGGEILQALQLGMIDGAEYSLPSIDRSIGFQSVAKYYYFPAWQSQSTFTSLMVSKAKWDEFSEAQQKAVKSACDINMIEMLAKGEYEQAVALNEIEKGGIELRRYSDEVLNALREQWEVVAKEQAERSPNFRKGWESYTAFRQEYATWGELGYLK